MSSLMQFDGNINKKGVGLLLYLVNTEEDGEDGWDAVEHVQCDCKFQKHAQLYEAYRKPCGMLGCWVVFRLNNEKIVPDLSVPIRVTKLPRDARKMSADECKKYWHS